MSKAFELCLALKEANVTGVHLARVFAEIAHQNQTRKFIGKPYISHLENVAYHAIRGVQNSFYIDDIRGTCELEYKRELISDVAYLHDTLEDTDVTKEELEILFGKECADSVVMLTDISKPSDGNRAVRKAIDRNHLAKASPIAKAVKIADLLNNLLGIPRTNPFYEVFKEEAKALLPSLKLPITKVVNYEGAKGYYTTETPVKLVEVLEKVLEGTFESESESECEPCYIWGECDLHRWY